MKHIPLCWFFSIVSTHLFNSSFILKAATRNVILYPCKLDSRSAAHGPPPQLQSTIQVCTRKKKKKHMIREMSGQWLWGAKPYGHTKDFRMGKLELFWSVTAASGVCVCVCFCCCFFSHHNVWGMDMGRMPVYFHYGYKDWQIISMNYRGQKNWYQC